MVLQQENVEAVALVLGLAFLYRLPQIWQYSVETLCRAPPARGVVAVFRELEMNTQLVIEVFSAFLQGFCVLVAVHAFSM
jgi:hypothetical protein